MGAAGTSTILAEYPDDGAGKAAEVARRRCEAHPLWSRRAQWRASGADRMAAYTKPDGTEVRFGVLLSVDGAWQ